MMRRFLALGALAAAAGLAGIPAAAQQSGQGEVGYPSDKQPVKPKHVLESLLGTLTPRPIGPDWNRPADLRPVTIAGFRGQRLNLQTHADLPNYNGALRLYHAPQGATKIAEFPFKVSIRGMRSLTFDCELLAADLSLGSGNSGYNRAPTEILAVTRHTFAVSQPGGGVVRIGFRPNVPSNPNASKVAVCRMEAAGDFDGQPWRTHERLDYQIDLGARNYTAALVDGTTGQAAGTSPFRVAPVATAYAFDEAYSADWLAGY